MTKMKNDEEKEENETTNSESTKIDEGKVVNNDKGVEDVTLPKEEKFSSRTSSEYLYEKYDSVDEFDFPTCSGDSFYDIFGKQEEILTEGSIVLVKNIKTIWEGGVIKIHFSDFPEDSKHLKLTWINKKRKIGFLFK